LLLLRCCHCRHHRLHHLLWHLLQLTPCCHPGPQEGGVYPWSSEGF
jgi:hypothetical protein